MNRDTARLPAKPFQGADRAEASPTRADVADYLNDLARRTGDRAFHRTARTLFQSQSAGRPTIDDRAAIAEAEALYATGKARSMWAAFIRVARSRYPSRRPKSVAERLQKKWRAQKKCPGNYFSGQSSGAS